MTGVRGFLGGLVRAIILIALILLPFMMVGIQQSVTTKHTGFAQTSIGGGLVFIWTLATFITVPISITVMISFFALDGID